jgi:hypothetical protein
MCNFMSHFQIQHCSFAAVEHDTGYTECGSRWDWVMRYDFELPGLSSLDPVLILSYIFPSYTCDMSKLVECGQYKIPIMPCSSM